MKPSRFSPFQRLTSKVAIGALLFLTACGGDNSTMPSMPEASSSTEQPAVTASGDGSVSAMDDDAGYEYGAMNLGARGENFSNDATFAPGAVITVKITTVRTDGEASGDAHCAIFDHTKPAGEQDLIDTSFKPGGWRHSDLSFMLSVRAPTTCGRQYQLDCGLGKRPPVGAKYTNDLIRAWHFGTDLCNETRLTPTPTPRPTPTPVCEVQAANNTDENPCATPTPTPTPTGTPTPRSTPTPDPTPTPRPTGTPQPTPTPTVTPTPPPNYQLNWSHLECVNGQLEIHFVLLNVPDGITPGTLTYDYGTIPVGNHTGNVWHYRANLPAGTYNVTFANVVVNGATVNLHNPGAYNGTYNCAPRPTPTPQPTPTPRPTPTPSCQQQNPPAASFTWSESNPPGSQGWTLFGSAQFHNEGNWEFILNATSSESECNSHNFDHEKRKSTRNLNCGEHSTNVDFSYEWEDHDSEWWRFTIKRNGSIWSESACIRNNRN